MLDGPGDCEEELIVLEGNFNNDNVLSGRNGPLKRFFHLKLNKKVNLANPMNLPLTRSKEICT